MGLKQKKKVNRGFVCGKEYCICKREKLVHGKSIVDKVELESVPIPDATDKIVQKILNKRKTGNLQNIVDKINQFKIGSGFAYA